MTPQNLWYFKLRVQVAYDVCLPVSASFTSDNFILIVPHQKAEVNKALAKVCHPCLIKGKFKFSIQSAVGNDLLLSLAQALPGSFLQPTPYLFKCCIEYVIQNCYANVLNLLLPQLFELWKFFCFCRISITLADVCWHKGPHNFTAVSPFNTPLIFLRNILLAWS